jgi:hypothetical protein
VRLGLIFTFLIVCVGINPTSSFGTLWASTIAATRTVDHQPTATNHGIPLV